MILARGGVVEIDGIEVVREHDAVRGVGCVQPGKRVARSLPANDMDFLEVRFLGRLETGQIGSDKENVAVA